MDAAPVYVRTTHDDRRVEVIAGTLCIDGVPEAESLVVIDEHPNRQAILRAVPLASHVGGRIVLTLAEASVAQAAMRRVHETFDGTPQAVRERMRRSEWQKSLADGAD